MNLIKRLVLDVLKPHQPNIDILSTELMNLEGVKGVKIKVEEIDEKTASVKITIQGENLDLKEIIEKLESLTCAVHSVDEVWAGDYQENVTRTLNY